jgi:hypothetical protein
VVSDLDLEELRLKRELAFKLKEQTESLKTKRGITVIVGGLSFSVFSNIFILSIHCTGSLDRVFSGWSA